MTGGGHGKYHPTNANKRQPHSYLEYVYVQAVQYYNIYNTLLGVGIMHVYDVNAILSCINRECIKFEPLLSESKLCSTL